MKIASDYKSVSIKWIVDMLATKFTYLSSIMDNLGQWIVGASS
jgi:hypothetical protein